MRGAKYAGFLAFLMVIMLLGAIPAMATESGNTDTGERQKSGEDAASDMPVRIVRGKFIGSIMDENGEVYGRVLGKYILYTTEDGTTFGRFMARWKYDDTDGHAVGVMRGGEFKGRWWENYQYRLKEQYSLMHSGDDETDTASPEIERPHYGVTVGGYALSEDGIQLRGTWEDKVTGKTGYLNAGEYVPDVVAEETVETTAVADDDSGNQPQKGRFKGAWVAVDTDDETPDVEGRLYGYYTKSPDQPGGRFAGRWTLGDGEKGSLHGRYRDGDFEGVWRDGQGKIGGTLEGTYEDGTFEGRWFHEDGTAGGYLKGEYGLVTAEDPSGIMNREGRPVEAEA